MISEGKIGRHNNCIQFHLRAQDEHRLPMLLDVPEFERRIEDCDIDQSIRLRMI